MVIDRESAYAPHIARWCCCSWGAASDQALLLFMCLVDGGRLRGASCGPLGLLSHFTHDGTSTGDSQAGSAACLSWRALHGLICPSVPLDLEQITAIRELRVNGGIYETCLQNVGESLECTGNLIRLRTLTRADHSCACHALVTLAQKPCTSGHVP
jgi:hypothetical protein